MKGLPKFNTTAWLLLGTAGSLALFAISLWSALARPGEALFPFRFGKIFSMVVGIVLAVHCVDMISYWKRNKPPPKR